MIESTSAHQLFSSSHPFWKRSSVHSIFSLCLRGGNFAAVQGEGKLIGNSDGTAESVFWIPTRNQQRLLASANMKIVIRRIDIVARPWTQLRDLIF